ncbi:MAG: glycosyltransferase family 4 protein [Oscillospiraceae bacterium]|nr:glycosyltransferase family 4 protein [Oscillospiraceae bacterium]
MKDMLFVSSWPDMKRAWSGTPMGLYTALSKRLHVSLLEGCANTGRIENILNGLSMGLVRLRSISRVIDQAPVCSGTPLFTFGEYTSSRTKDTYCYQDLSVDYLLRLRKNNHPAASYAFKKVIPTFIAEQKNKRAKEFYKNCAAVFTMSKWLHDDLINNTGLPADKVHHVGGGSNIDVSKIDYSKKEGNKFLFVGKDWARKNGELVVEAFKKLSAAHPECNPQLYIAGPEEKPACCNDYENIVFLGRLSYDQLVHYYNLCDYYVMPSNFEAYGLVFAEALCFGLPCIGKNICAMPEFIQHGKNGSLINDNDPDELSAAMGKLLLEGREMAQAVQANKEYYLSKYAWDAVADRIIRVLQHDGYLDKTV